MKLRNQVYNYTNARKINEIIPDAFIDKLDIPRKDNPALAKGRNKKKFARSVFYTFLQLIIDDCIENNNKFVSPNKENFVVYIREKAPAEQRRLATRTSKIYVAVNLIASDFKFYEFVLRSKHLPRKKHRKIRIAHSKYKEITSRVNKGQRYFVR